MGKKIIELPFQHKFNRFIDPSMRLSIIREKIDQRIKIHWHEFCELEYIVSGAGIQILNGIKYKIEKGSLYFLTPRDFHEIIAFKEEPIELYNVKLSETIIRRDIYQNLFINDYENITVITGQDHLLMENNFNILFDEYNNNRLFSNIILANMLEQILITIIRKRNSVNDKKIKLKHDYQEHPVYKSLIYMQNHFHDDLTLEQIASQSHISVNYFSELFHKTVGCSFQNYLQNLRLRNALVLLINSGLTATEVCEKSGFNSYAHFSRLFKQKYGCSPRSFRNGET